MIRLLILVLFTVGGSSVKGVSIDDLTASQLLASCQLRDYGELEVLAEHHEALTTWAKERSVSGFDALRGQPSLETKALSLFDMAATDAEFYQISLSALRRFSHESYPESYLSAVLMPTERKRGLLAINYRDQRLRDLLEACQKKLTPSSSLAKLIELTLSGEQAKSVVKHAGDGGYPERYGPLAKLALEGKIPSLAFASNAHQGTDSNKAQARDRQEDATTKTKTTEQQTDYWPWVIGIVTAAGLLWLLLKRRS